MGIQGEINSFHIEFCESINIVCSSIDLTAQVGKRHIDFLYFEYFLRKPQNCHIFDQSNTDAYCNHLEFDTCWL